MTSPGDILRDTQAQICRPWLRHILSHADWTAFAQLAVQHAWVLLAMWADTIQLHALFLDADTLTVVPVSTPAEASRYPALSPELPGAKIYERMIRDMWGHTGIGGTDQRPWLDHGTWPLANPMAARPTPRTAFDTPTRPDVGPSDKMLLPLGPIWGRIEEAAHLRLTLHGPAIRHAEARLGFTHKGTMTLMRGKSPRAAARFAARLSGDATVAHSVAFARATESALDVTAPARAAALRLVMLELERVAGHLDNLAEVARLAGAQTVRSRAANLREILLRATETAFGHRLMMDCVVPGGVITDIAADAPEVILRALGDIASQLETLRRLHGNAGLSSRLLGLGRVEGSLASALGVGGVVGRASGRAFDVRTAFSSDYENSARAIRPDGDAATRQALRIVEIEQSLGIIGAAMGAIPAGPVTIALPQASGEGIGCAESVRGDIWHWLRLDHGQIAAVFPRDPGWALWPLAERVLEQAAADDADLIRASFALPVSGMDL